MITKAKMMIISTVPVAMVFEFMLLNTIFETTPAPTNVSQETFTYTNQENAGTVPVKPKSAPLKFKSKRKITVLSFSKPAAHTFEGCENMNLNYKTGGAIIK